MTSLAFELNWLHVVLKRNNIISNIVQDRYNEQQKKKKSLRSIISSFDTVFSYT